jgi:plasmid stability protein
MATLTIDLEDEVEEQLRRRAVANGSSLEAEARAILADAARETEIPVATEAMLQRRREVLDKFISGEWSAELEGFEEGRAADRAAAKARAALWDE